MLCEDVRRVIYFFLDGSLGDQKQHDLKAHLDDCVDCDMRTKIQWRLRQFVRQRLAPVAAPDSLRNRVSQSLRASVAK